MSVLRETPAEPFVFVSYTQSDLAWATWIAATLEEAGLSTRIQTWDSVPGSNFVSWMSAQLAGARWTVAVYSAAYFDSQWCTQEWTSALARQTLLPLRIEPVIPPPPLNTITWVDLFGMDQGKARDQLLRAVQVEVLPRLAVTGFPGGVTFPGPAPGFGHQPEPVRAFDFAETLAAASENLTSGDASIRISGIYALERLAATANDPATSAAVAEILATRLRATSGRSGSSARELAACALAIGRLPIHHPVDLSYVTLTGASLSGVRLTGVNLRGAKLGGAQLSRADLTDADLNDAVLVDVNLADANLTGARLSKADLSSARLARAIIVDVDLTGANLLGADLTDARIDNVILSKVRWSARSRDATHWPRGMQIRGDSYTGYGSDSVSTFNDDVIFRIPPKEREPEKGMGGTGGIKFPSLKKKR